MPYPIPSCTPLTPQQVERGFDYLLALQTGGGAAAPPLNVRLVRPG